MHERLVVFAPEKAISRYGNHGVAAGLEDPGELRQGPTIVVKVFEDVGCDDGIGEAVAERDRLGPAPCHARQSAAWRNT